MTTAKTVKVIGYLYIAQATAGFAVGFAIPWLRLVGWM